MRVRVRVRVRVQVRVWVRVWVQLRLRVRVLVIGRLDDWHSHVQHRTLRQFGHPSGVFRKKRAPVPA